MGVTVSVVEPGNYKSDIMASMVERMREKGYSTEGSMAKERMDALLASPTDRGQYKEPDEVAEAVLDALFSESPRRRYMVTPNEGEAAFTIMTAVNELVQLNANQPYEFDRDRLIAMLDEALDALLEITFVDHRNERFMVYCFKQRNIIGADRGGAIH